MAHKKTQNSDFNSKGEDYRANNDSGKADEQNSQTMPADATIATGAVNSEPITTEEEFSTLQQETDLARQKAAEYFDGWQRERADFSNYKRRVERDQSQMVQNITGEVIKKYIVILDDIERALKNRPTQGEGASWAEGIELIYRKLKNILESEGIKPIAVNNNTNFDPTIHEAISHEDSSDHKSGEIIEVVQQGYMLGDRVLRPALVRVAR